jgi:hypothetical protein
MAPPDPVNSSPPASTVVVTQPAPVVAAPSARVSPAPAPAPTASQPQPQPVVPKSAYTKPMNELEIRAGGTYTAPNSGQFELGVGWRFHPRWIGGLTFQANDKGVSGGGEFGFRFFPFGPVAIQPTVLGGAGHYINNSFTAGSLFEDVTLKGLFGYFGTELRALIQPKKWGGYLGARYTREFLGSTDSIPRTLKSGDNPRADANRFLLTFGILWGAAQTQVPDSSEKERLEEEEKIRKAKEEARTKEEEEARKKETPPTVDEDTRKANEKVKADADQIKKELDEKRARQFEEEVKKKIDLVTKNLVQLESEVAYFNSGFQRINRMRKTLIETEIAMKQKKLGPEKQQLLNNELEELRKAVEMGSDRKPVSSTEQSKTIRSGLHVEYPGSRSGINGKRMLSGLEKIDNLLREQKQTEMARPITVVFVKLKEYLDAHPQPITTENLLAQANSIKTTIQSLEPKVKELNLDSTERWKSIRSGLENLQEKMAKRVRQAEAFTSFLLTVTNYFGENGAKTFGMANHTFDAANTFLNNPPNGVSFEDLKRNYLDSFRLIANELDEFIEYYSRQRGWKPATEKAKTLLCKVSPTHDRCTVASPPPGRPPQAPRLTSAQREALRKRREEQKEKTRKATEERAQKLKEKREQDAANAAARNAAKASKKTALPNSGGGTGKPTTKGEPPATVKTKKPSTVQD